jgi:hypothetical protein
MIRPWAAIALTAALVTGCGSTVVPPAPSTGPSVGPSASLSPTAGATSSSPSPAPSTFARDDGWRADIDALLAARERLHPNPWHDLTREAWVAAADDVKARIPTLTDDQALTELVRLSTLPGLAGREGHTAIFPFIPGSGTHIYPILMWQFSDGLVITAARAPYADLIGSRIESVAGRPVAEVMALVEPLAPRDNASNLLAYAPLYLRTSELLAGVGVLPKAGPATFGVISASGARRDVVIEPITADDDVAWHGDHVLDLPAGEATWLRDNDKALWWTYLADSKTVYVQYNSVEAGIDAVANEILARAKLPDVDRVIVDLRHNGGGDNTTYRHLLGVLQDPAIDQPGKLTVLIGRLTFSAAANFATDLERTTHAGFAGEAMGGSPNLYGDARRVDLPYSGQAVFMATRYWQMSTADDERVTIEPDLAIPLSFEAWSAGLDPVLDAVTAGPPAGE